MEEEKNTANNTFMNYEMNVDLGRVFGLEKAIEIINQLAEEYNQNLTEDNPKPQTRIEKIHSMSVEEIADRILASEISALLDFCQEFSECQNLNEKGEEIPDEMCKKCLIQWLNSPE